MSEKDTRIIPPGQFGSPFFEPSGSMQGPGGDFDFPLILSTNGGTDLAAALDAAAKFQPDRSRFDRHHIVITDGEPPASLHESHGDVLAALIASLKPGEQLVCLDYSGAQPPFAECASPRVIAGNGLLPVPAASDLVARICDTVDGEAQPVRTDQCCGCGGCDRK